MAQAGDRRPCIINDERYQRLLLVGFSYGRDAARTSSAICKETLVGSAASDTMTSGSDADMLLERSDLVVDESVLKYRDDLPCYVRVPAKGLPENTPAILLDGGEYIRADRLRDQFEQLFGTTIGGDGKSKVGQTMSESETTDSRDYVPQIRIDNIPGPARSFITRTRSWPCEDIVSLVSTGQFHLAARPAPCNPDETHDFCLSFAKAEVVLTRAMSVNQVLCIEYLKTARSQIDDGRGVLTSYHMKTTSLLYFEQATADTSANDRPVIGILDKLDHYLEVGILPHYFVPTMNLFTRNSPSQLVDIRRRLHSFMGFSIITHDVTGISSHTKLLLAIDMMSEVMTRRLASQQSRCLRAAEKLYLKVNPKRDSDLYNDVDIASMKKELCKSLPRIIKIDTIKAGYLEDINEYQSVLKAIAVRWVGSRKIPHNINCELTPDWMRLVTDAYDEPLDIVFRMDSTETDIGTDRPDMTVYQQREHIMEKWMTFIDDIIMRMTSHVNIIVDELWDVMCGSMSTNEITKCIDRLLLSNDNMTSELLSSAICNMAELSSAMDSFTDSFKSPGSRDARANIKMVSGAVETLFIPVEYAIVRNIRLQAAGASCSQTARLRRVQNPESSEYKCIAACSIVEHAIVNFHNMHEDLHRLRGWQEFMATTIGSLTT